jgi:hypothetical protein
MKLRAVVTGQGVNTLDYQWGLTMKAMDLHIPGFEIINRIRDVDRAEVLAEGDAEQIGHIKETLEGSSGKKVIYEPYDGEVGDMWQKAWVIASVKLDQAYDEIVKAKLGFSDGQPGYDS